MQRATFRKDLHGEGLNLLRKVHLITTYLFIDCKFGNINDEFIRIRHE